MYFRNSFYRQRFDFFHVLGSSDVKSFCQFPKILIAFFTLQEHPSYLVIHTVTQCIDHLTIRPITCLNFHLLRQIFQSQPPLRRQKSALQNENSFCVISLNVRRSIHQCTDTFTIRQTYLPFHPSAALDFLAVATATPLKICLAEE